MRTPHISDYKPMNLHQIYSKICTINPHQLSRQTKTELQNMHISPSKIRTTIKLQINKTRHPSNYQKDKKEHIAQTLETTTAKPRKRKTYHQIQNRRKQTRNKMLQENERGQEAMFSLMSSTVCKINMEVQHSSLLSFVYFQKRIHRKRVPCVCSYHTKSVSLQMVALCAAQIAHVLHLQTYRNCLLSPTQIGL